MINNNQILDGIICFSSTDNKLYRLIRYDGRQHELEIKINIPKDFPHVQIEFLSEKLAQEIKDQYYKSEYIRIDDKIQSRVGNPYNGGISYIGPVGPLELQLHNFVAWGRIYIPLEIKNLNKIKQGLIELITHEVTHIYDLIYSQSGQKREKLNSSTLLDYYLMLAEIFAHLKGFRQKLNYSKDTSLEDHIKAYFQRIQDLGKISKEEKDFIIKKYLEKAKELGFSLSKFKSARTTFNSKKYDMESVIYIAKIWRTLTIDEIKKRLGGDLNKKDEEGNTILDHILRQNPNMWYDKIFDFIKSLDDNNIDINLKNENIERILNYTVSHNKIHLNYLKKKIRQNNAQRYFLKYFEKYPKDNDIKWSLARDLELVD